MPRPRSSQQSTTLSPGQASYVLERLVADRRISTAEIYRYLTDVHREISSLEERLNTLRGAAGTGTGSSSTGTGGGAAPARRRGRGPGRPRGTGTGAGAGAAGGAAPTGRRRGRPPGRKSAAKAGAGGEGAPSGGGKKRRGGAALTPEQRASRQLQGRYLGLIRQIPANKRGQYQKTAKERGREAAIKEIQEALHK